MLSFKCLKTIVKMVPYFSQNKTPSKPTLELNREEGKWEDGTLGSSSLSSDVIVSVPGMF